MTIEEFAQTYLGKQVEFHSYGTGALNQCVDLVNAYINHVLDNKTKDYTEIIGTNAKDFNTKYDPDDFEWITNTPEAIIKKGDIAVWNGRVGGGVGHVAVAIEDGSQNSFRSLDQNWSQVERVTIENHNYTNVSGWLRPKNVHPMATITQKELDEIRTRRDELYNITQEQEKTINQLREDLKKEQENSQTYLKQLEKITDEEKSTTEQLITAEHALQPFKDEQEAIRKALGSDSTDHLVEDILNLKKSKVKQMELPIVLKDKIVFCIRLLFT